MPLPFTLFRSVGHAELPRRSARGQEPQDPPAGANLEQGCRNRGHLNRGQLYVRLTHEQR